MEDQLVKGAPLIVATASGWSSEKVIVTPALYVTPSATPAKLGKISSIRSIFLLVFMYVQVFVLEYPAQVVNGPVPR